LSVDPWAANQIPFGLRETDEISFKLQPT